MTNQKSGKAQSVKKGANVRIATTMLIGAITLFGVSACSTSAKPTANASQVATATSPVTTATETAKSTTTVDANKVPTSVSNVGEYGENIYDAAKANDWKQATAKLSSLKKAANGLDANIKNEDPNEDKLDDTLAALNKAVAAKNQLATMREANRVTLLATNLSAPFNPPVPVQVSLLDYYGRQLEIGVAANDINQLQATAKDMQKTWSELRPAIESKGASQEAQKFDKLVAQVQAASSPKDYSRLATTVLDEVDNLEKVFK